MIFRRWAKQEQMNHFLFFGLGNPGRDYAQTKHNIGFLVIDRLAERWGIKVDRYKFKSLMGDYLLESRKIILVKPHTYMNLSGTAARSFVNYFKPPLSQVMVIFDDLDLPFGTIRIRASGGSSGQKGMQSIITQLGTKEFARMRVGIGRPPGKLDSVDYVLKGFKPAEKEDLMIILNCCADAIEVFINEGVEIAMTKFNNNYLDGDS